MPGVRYEGWRHTRVSGDPAAGAPYLTTATKLLGYVFEDAKRNNLGVHSLRQELEDGTVIIAEKHGDIPRITIVPAPSGSPQPETRTPDDFVVWARDSTHTTGIDADKPQQILRATKAKGGGGGAGGLSFTGSSAASWKTYFFDSDIAGHASFPGAKGTYASMFPDGVCHAGNVDWKGADGERLSWYGPSTRYWYDPHIKPRAQYGKFVFLLGHKLLDVEQYIIDSDPDPAFDARWVMGAALDGALLYVVHADLPDGTTDMTPAPANSCFVDAPWPVGDVPVQVCTYAVVRTDAVTWNAVPGSRTVLWSGDIANALNPWFFNESVTAGVSIGLPDSVLARELIVNEGANTLIAGPSTTQQVHTFRLDPDDGWVMEHVTIELAPGGTAVIAADFVEDSLHQMTVRRFAKDDLASAYAIGLGATEWETCAVKFLGSVEVSPGFFRPVYENASRNVLFADIRAGVVVLSSTEYRAAVSAPANSSSSVTMEVWRKGIKVHSQVLRSGTSLSAVDTGYTRQIGFFDFVSGDHPPDGFMGSVTVAPHFPLYQTFTRYQSEPRYSWQGAHGLNAYLGYPASARFGAARFNGYAGSFVNRIDALTDESGLRIADDFDTNNSVLGCATSNDVTLLSCYSFEYQTGKSVSFADDATLADLTGIGGDDARYHPIWLLGRQPIT